MFGFLNINKPEGVTSRAALNSVGKLIHPAKIGHAGTLDPLATGVLVACVGPATRLTKYVQEMPKKYTGSFRLGMESPSEDIEGDVTLIQDAPGVSAVELTAVLPNFVGTISQLPPTFSALKVEGKRAYDLARKGAVVKLEPRPIEIIDLNLIRFEYPDFQLQITCGSGTYIRSLGRDIAKRLGSGAVMTALVRSAVGGFAIDQALNLESLSREICEQRLYQPISAVPGLETVTVSREQILGFQDGVPLRLDEGARQLAEELVAVDQENRLIAVLRRKFPGIFAPSINFAHYWAKFGSQSLP